jgi:hypothetical protein
MSILSVQHFMTDPKGYLSFHKVSVANNASINGAMTPGPVADCVGTELKMQRWTQRPAGGFLTLIHSMRHNENTAETVMGRMRSQLARLPGARPLDRQFVLFPSDVDIGFRWLPFVENTVSYADFPGAGVRFVLTGPLSGCTVAVGVSGGAPVMLHANCNRASGDAARVNQAQMIAVAARSGLGISAGTLADAVYKRDYNGFGFVFGRRVGVAGWKFYAYGTDTGCRKLGEF